MLVVNSRIQIPNAALVFRYVRSSGPGGQNVNKVSSKAMLRWNARSSPGVPPDVRARFLSRYSGRLTQDGELVLTSQRHRDQARNADDCLEKLRAMLLAVAVAPVKRHKTRPTAASRERRLAGKRAESDKKRQRRGRPSEHD